MGPVPLEQQPRPEGKGTATIPADVSGLAVLCLITHVTVPGWDVAFLSSPEGQGSQGAGRAGSPEPSCQSHQPGQGFSCSPDTPRALEGPLVYGPTAFPK